MPQVARHAPLRYDKAECLKLSVNLVGPPIPILLRQSLNQIANIAADLRPATAWPGSPPPIRRKPAVLADHGIGLDDNQDFSPAGPTMAQSAPEERSNVCTAGTFSCPK
jgi:hypothetical protein